MHEGKYAEGPQPSAKTGTSLLVVQRQLLKPLRSFGIVHMGCSRAIFEQMRLNFLIQRLLGNALTTHSRCARRHPLLVIEVTMVPINPQGFRAPRHANQVTVVALI